jgi:hypothetical protein
LPLSEERRKAELQYLMNMAVINGYETKIVERIYDKHRRKAELKNFTTLQPLDKCRSKRQKVTANRFTRFAILPFYPPLTYKIEKVLKRHGINVGYTNRGKLKNILCNEKKKKSDEESSGIYEVSCKHCDEKYVGKTGRRFETRDKEHSGAILSRQVEKSSVARHCITTGHKRGDMRVLKRISEGRKLDAYESLYIDKEENLMNRGEAPITSKLFKYAHR